VLGSLPPIATAEEALADAVRVELGTAKAVRVLSLDMLIGVKAAMGRPKDKQTELELRAIADARKHQT
jgi:hypothetical protein